MSKLAFGLSIVASFICGAIIMFMLQTDNTVLPTSERAQISVIEPAISEQAAPVAPISVSGVSNVGHQTSPEELTQEALKQQIAELELQVESQQAVIARYRTNALTSDEIDSHLDQLYTLLAQQERNETWAYQVETAMSDFLIMADLPIQPNVSVSKCKSSVCQFKLQRPDDVAALPEHYWRNITDDLMLQSWWKQFKYTSTTSSDDELVIVVSTD
nr:hypothetical protein [Lelliottia steviae]